MLRDFIAGKQYCDTRLVDVADSRVAAHGATSTLRRKHWARFPRLLRTVFRPCLHASLVMWSTLQNPNMCRFVSWRALGPASNLDILIVRRALPVRGRYFPNYRATPL
jgi:hypothetical protein